MTKRQAENRSRYFGAMSRAGFTRDEAETLRRCEMTLHRWAEQECGDSNMRCSWAIERDEQTNVPYRVTMYHSDGKRYQTRIADRETGSLKRARAIVSARNGRSTDTWWLYQQGDCRGCALYVVNGADIPTGGDIASYYTRGLAVCY